MKKFLPFLALALFIFSITGLLWSVLPPTQETIAIPMQEVRLDFDESDQSAILMTPYLIQISLPTALKRGGKANLAFALNRTEETLFLTKNDVNLYDHFNVLIELRPDFPNLNIDPLGSLSTALIEEQDISNSWTLSTALTERQAGTFWVYLTFYPLDEAQETQHTAILAKQFSFEIKSFLGLSTNTTAIVSAAGLTASFLLGWPNLSALINQKFTKFKKR